MQGKAKIIFYLLAAFLLLMIGGGLVSALTQNLQIKELTQGLGVWGYLFLLAGIAVGGIIVPLSAVPFLLVGLALYGFRVTFILYYVGNTLVAPVVDFWLARKFGRPVVARLAGRRALAQIDKIAAVAGVRVLAILRAFGGVLFDSISYAMGLTNISFKAYFWLTALLPLPGMWLVLTLIEKGLTDSPLFFGVIVILSYLGGGLTLYLVYKGAKNKKRRPITDIPECF